MPTASKFFRVATEGDTTDGRKIERSWIEQAAKNFNRAKYGARVWLEHIRGIVPGNVFDALGDVTALKAEEVSVDGKKKLALFAQIEPLPSLLAINKAKQKLYTSCEIDPNFAKSGEAYLVGLAVTDSPASLGTEMLAFSANAGANSPLAARKQNPDNLFTAAQEVAIEFEQEDVTPSLGETLFAKVKSLLSLEKKDHEARFADIGQAVEAIALSQKQSLELLSAIPTKELRTEVDAFRTQLDEMKKVREKDAADFAAFRGKLEGTPGHTVKRPDATGGNGEIATDC